jgi:hypothetical protein
MRGLPCLVQESVVYSGKGKTIVIIKKDTSNQTSEAFLQENQFRKINKDPARVFLQTNTS